MKSLKVLTLILLASATVFTAGANTIMDDDRPISIDQIPANSREFINTHFNGIAVSYATIDDEGYFGPSYDVNLVGGAQIEFASDGNWKEVNCRFTAVPDGIVPSQIVAYVNQNFPGQIITKIDKGRRSYEVELRNGLEIKFDLNFNMIGYDD